MIPLIVAKFVSDIVIDAFQLYFSNYCTHRGGSEKSERELDKINQLLSGGAESIPLYVNSPSMMPHSLWSAQQRWHDIIRQKVLREW